MHPKTKEGAEPAPKSEAYLAMEKILDEALREYEFVTGHKYPTRRPLGLGGKLQPETLGFIQRNVLSHFASLDGIAWEVEQIRWEKQYPDALIATLRAAERRSLERIRNKEMYVHTQPGDEVVVSFPDGYKWVLLDRHACDDEAKAMGHCGNRASHDESERTLSLRKRVKKGDKPFLTFILGSNGKLGEMKARFNNKPSGDLHPYIIALLKLPMIKGIIGGGYAAKNNFAMHDLTDAEQTEVMAANPALASQFDKS